MKTSKSVTSIVQEAEERAFRAAKAEARRRPLTMAQVLSELERRARSTHWWLQKFGGADAKNKRPDFDIEQKRLELSVLVQVRDRWAKGEERPDVASSN